MNAARPYADTQLAIYLRKRLLELKPKKTQAEIATQSGFNTANVMSMLKAGSIRLPIDRVLPLATALDTDPAYLMLLTLAQVVGDTDAQAIVDIFSGAVTRNEMTWVVAVRELSGLTDPPLTKRSRAAIQVALGK